MTSAQGLLLTLLICPWVSALVLAFWPQKFSLFARIFSIASGCLCLLVWSRLFAEHGNDTIPLSYDWIRMGGQSISLSWLWNSQAATMLGLLAMVQAAVQVYASHYLRQEPHVLRFFAFFQGFVGAMTGLILSNGLWMFYGFWELVGLGSYLFIGFWTEKPKALLAARKAFLINRLADIALLIGLIALAQHFQTTQFDAMKIGLHGPIPWGIGCLLVIGAAAKSAQFPFSAWLPDAMEGPSPASALIHAATMVTAGVYLGIKLHALQMEEVRLMMGALGGISLLWGGYQALKQEDLKRMLAYSTISQLGLMWMGMGGAASLYHLWVHGFFKSALFLSAGMLLHHTQSDAKNPIGITEIGKKHTFPPLLVAWHGMASLGLIGFPFSQAFYSKEGLAAEWFMAMDHSAYAWAYLALLTALGLGIILSTWYTLSQFMRLFFSASDHPKQRHSLGAAQEYLPLGLLAMGSLWIWTGIDPFHLGKTWFSLPLFAELNSPPLLWMGINGLAWCLGLLAWWFRRNPSRSEQKVQISLWAAAFHWHSQAARNLHQRIEKTWDRSLDVLGKSQVVLAHIFAKLDQWGIDGLLVGGSQALAKGLSKNLSTWQNGRVKHYWWGLILCLSLSIFYYLMRIQP